MFPYHVFYNGWEANRFRAADDINALRDNPNPHPDPPYILRAETEGPLHRYGHRLESRDPALWGCAALSTYSVAQLHSSSRHRCHAPRYLAHAMPWSQLFAEQDPSAADPIDASGYTALDRIHRHLYIDTAEARRYAQTDNDLDLVLNTPRVTIGALREQRLETLPNYAMALLEANRGQASVEEVQVIMDAAPATHTIVANLDDWRT